MRTRSIILLFIASLFLTPMLINSGQATDEEDYSLQIKITTSCLLRFQSISPIDVKVELTNIGNKTFNGTLSIEGETREGLYWPPLEYPISNLTKDAVQGYTRSFGSYDAGIYWFTIKIVEERSSTIKLYRDSKLVDEGWQVEAKTSISLRSFGEFIAILAIVVGAIVAIAVAVYKKKK